ncbi:MAG: hypothetical protein ABI548_21260 [Polyangiaceae bacterium]
MSPRTEHAKAKATQSDAVNEPRASFTIDAAASASDPIELPVLRVALTRWGTCALLSDHTVWCWGYDGGSSGARAARQIPLAHVVEIQSAGSLTTAVTEGGAAYFWGQVSRGSYVQLSLLPQRLAERGVVHIAIGDGTACALTLSGAVDCWSLLKRSAPPRRVVASGARAVAVANGRACAVLSDGPAVCWEPGQEPTTAPELTFAVELASLGDLVCGRLAGGALRCAGPAEAAREALALLADSAVALRSSPNALCAIAAHGPPHCAWREFESESPPQIVDPPSRWIAPELPVTDAGRAIDHGCALVGPALFCWGNNTFGQLAAWDSEALGPVRVHLGDTRALNQVRAVAVGTGHRCVLGSDERVRCWGENEHGQLGTGDTVGREGPTLVPGLSKVSTIGASSQTTCALTDGNLWCFGEQHWLEPGHGCPDPEQRNERCSLSPRQVASSVTEFALGDDQVCFRGEAGGVKCRGDNDRGQLGTGDFARSDTPRPVLVAANTALADATRLFGFASHTCALRRSGAMVCWGANEPFAQGRPYNGPLKLALATPLAGSATAVSEDCALGNDQRLTCWGNVFPDDHRSFSFAGSAVGLCGVERVANGPGLCLARKDGTVECLGFDDAWENPLELVSRGGQLSSLVGWGSRICALADDGALTCFSTESDQVLPDVGLRAIETRAWPAADTGCKRDPAPRDLPSFPPEPAATITAYNLRHPARASDTPIADLQSGVALPPAQARRLLSWLNKPSSYTSTSTCHDPSHEYVLRDAQQREVGELSVGDCFTLEAWPEIPANLKLGGNVVAIPFGHFLRELCRELKLGDCEHTD